MDSSPGSPPGPHARSRAPGPLNPLSIAIGAVLLAAGGAFGWNMRADAPTARPAPAVVHDALALEPVAAGAICGDAGSVLLRDTALQSDAGATERLADYVPRESPLPGYERVRSGALDAAGDTDYLSGAVEGHVSSFRPPGHGGYDVSAYRFLTRPAAAETIASAVGDRACRAGATVLVARGRPGLIVVREVDGAGLSAWWLTHANVVVVVRYSGGSDEDADMANLAVVAEATTPPG